MKNERQKIEKSKGVHGNLREEKGEVERSEVRGLPHSQSNLLVYPSLCEDSSVGTSMMDEGTQVPTKEPTIGGVMNTLLGCPNIQKRVSFQGKEDFSCKHQGTIAKLNTSTIASERSVSDSLSLCEPNVSLPCVDNVHVESVDTLVDTIDDRIDSSSKVDLCTPSVDTRALNDSSLSCDNCVDQFAFECDSLVEEACDVTNEPQFGDNDDIVDHLNTSDSLSLSFIEGPYYLSCS